MSLFLSFEDDLDNDVEVSATNNVEDEADVLGDAGVAGGSADDEEASLAERALATIADALDDIRTEQAEEGEVSTESAAIFAAKLQTTAMLLGLPLNAVVGLESAHQTRTLVSLEAAGEGVMARLWAAIKRAWEAAKKAVIKFYDYLFDTGMRMSRQATALKKETGGLKGGGVLQVPAVNAAITTRGGKGSDVLKMVKSHATLANYPSKEIEDMIKGVAAKPEAGINAHNKSLTEIMTTYGANQAGAGRWTINGLVGGRSIVAVVNVTDGKTFFGNKKLARLEKFAVNTPKGETYTNPTMASATEGEANSILDAVIDIAGKLTNNKRAAAAAFKSMDKIVADFGKEADSTAAHKDEVEIIRAIISTVSRVNSNITRIGGGLALKACGAGLTYVKASIKRG